LSDLEAFRKSQALINADSVMAEDIEAAGDDTLPLFNKLFRSRDESSGESYSRRKARSRKVSTFSGFALILIFLLTVLAFLWNFWIKDIFEESQRIDIPSFVSEDSEDTINSDAYKDTFNFHVIYAIDPNTPEGIIISQKPEAGRSMALIDGGIDIELTVSTGIMMTTMPDMVNHEYREATIALEKIGFVVETETIASDTITEGYVVSTNPSANEESAAGSTVYISISGGPELKQVTMPSVVGKSVDAATSKLNGLLLDVGSVSEVESDSAAGTVTWQSVDAGESVAEHTIIYLKVSKGPKASPSPQASQSAQSAAPTDGAGVGT